jgi:hypothetical protein
MEASYAAGAGLPEEDAVRMRAGSWPGSPIAARVRGRGGAMRGGSGEPMLRFGCLRGSPRRGRGSCADFTEVNEKGDGGRIIGQVIGEKRERQGTCAISA